MEAEIVLLEEWSFHFSFLINLFCNKKSCMLAILKKMYGSVQASPSSKQSNVNSRLLIHALKHILY